MGQSQERDSSVALAGMTAGGHNSWIGKQYKNQVQNVESSHSDGSPGQAGSRRQPRGRGPCHSPASRIPCPAAGACSCQAAPVLPALRGTQVSFTWQELQTALSLHVYMNYSWDFILFLALNVGTTGRGRTEEVLMKHLLFTPSCSPSGINLESPWERLFP